MNRFPSASQVELLAGETEHLEVRLSAMVDACNHELSRYNLGISKERDLHLAKSDIRNAMELLIPVTEHLQRASRLVRVYNERKENA